MHDLGKEKGSDCCNNKPNKPGNELQIGPIHERALLAKALMAGAFRSCSKTQLARRMEGGGGEAHFDMGWATPRPDLSIIFLSPTNQITDRLSQNHLDKIL